jgi:hypothetical protein
VVLDPDKLREQIAKQSEQEEESEDLPPITTLHIDVKGTRGKRYVGDFTFKVPTLGDQVEMARIKTTYLPQGGAADVNGALLVEQIAYLTITIQKPTPAWYKPFALYDATPISALYMEAIGYERRFHGADVKPGEAPEADSEGSEDAGGSSVEDPNPVGRKVSPPAKRSETLVAHSSRER